MKSTLLKLSTFILVACYANFAQTSNINIRERLPENVVLHSINNSTGNQENWHVAISEFAFFSIKFPVPFEEWSTKIDGRSINSLSATSKEKIKFLAFAIPKFKYDRYKDAQDLTKRFLKDKRYKRIRSFNYNGYSATEAKVVGPQTSTVYRFFLTDDYIYQLSVEYPRSQREAVLKISYQFFDSFKINTPN